MKKITTLLFSVFICALTTQAQELMVNGGFENWTNATPDGWTLTAVTNQSFTKETSIVKSGSSSLKSAHTGTGGTAKIVIAAKINVTAGNTYRFSYWYYVDPTSTNAETAFRNWGYWNNPDGTQGTFDQLNLQMGDGTSYVPTNVKGEWINRSVDVTAPANSGTVQLELRFYKNATIYVDDISFSSVVSGLNSINQVESIAYVSGKDLVIKNGSNGATVEIYSALGAKVQTSVIDNGRVELNNLQKGIYIVRLGKQTQKIVL